MPAAVTTTGCSGNWRIPPFLPAVSPIAADWKRPGNTGNPERGRVGVLPGSQPAATRPRQPAVCCAPRTTTRTSWRNWTIVCDAFLTNHVANRASRAARPGLLVLDARRFFQDRRIGRPPLRPFRAGFRRGHARSRHGSRPVRRRIVFLSTPARPDRRRDPLGHRRADGRAGVATSPRPGGRRNPGSM